MKNYIGISRDHSASMRMLSKAAANDYNETIKQIQQSATEHDIDTIVSVVKCGVGRGRGSVEREIVNSNVQVLKPIQPNQYIADGSSTPLFDSVGDLITQFENVPDASDPNVAFVIMVITDGEENSSTKWTGTSIGKKIKQLQATDRWTFVFRVPTGNKSQLMQYGIPEGNILEWDTSSERGLQSVSSVNTQAIKQFYTARSTGITSTGKFYADLSKVTLKEVKQNLVDVTGDFTSHYIQPNYDGWEIRTFVEQIIGKTYSKGCAYYQLSKSEKVQASKQIAIRDKVTGKIYSGMAARNMLGLPAGSEVRLAPSHTLQNGSQYEVFIQSSSVNRKLSGGTWLLLNS